MRYIELHKWPRRELYKFFSTMDYPHFNICNHVDISNTYHYARQKRISLFKAILFAVCQAANRIPEFRTRIRGDKVVEHDAVHPSVTVLTAEKVFGFCHIKYSSDPARFFAEAERSMEAARRQVSLADEPGRDDYLFISAIPWVRFSGISHPIHMHPVDSVPRFSWGKYKDDGGKVDVPFATQVHHGLADGYHVGLFVTMLEGLLAEPDALLQGAER